MWRLLLMYVATCIHYAANLYLIYKIWSKKSCAGISGKTHILYVIVYATRYLDLLTVYVSRLNTICKIIYLVLSFVIVQSVYVFFRKTRETQYDTFRMELLITCCMVAAILINHDFTVVEVLWTFSIYLEAVAILPQFHLISKARYMHTYVQRYLIALAVYRFLYLPHWFYRYVTEGHYDKLSIASVIIQFILYLDFFLRVVPKLQSRVGHVSPKIAIIDSQFENNGEFLKSNMGNIVLTPDTFKDASNDKETLLKDEEANKV